MARVAIVVGSKTDLPLIEGAEKTLRDLQIEHETKVLSAHRTPDETRTYAREAEARGIKVIIAAAGGAAHLPGFLASLTFLPVIGVPLDTTVLKGIDSLLSILQMPSGVPVATMAIGKAGATNAALMAAQILALEDKGVKERLLAYREEMKRPAS